MHLSNAGPAEILGVEARDSLRSQQQQQMPKGRPRARGQGLQRLLRVEEVPDQYKEKYINTSYRRPYSSASECLLSLFTLHNETLNIWTHFLPFLFLTFHFWRTFPSHLYPLTSIPARYYPMIAIELSVCAYLLGSSLAHTFNCMTPRMRHVCFYMDYAAISLFGVGGATANFYYFRPLNTGFLPLESPNLFIGLSALISTFSVYVLCVSRHRWEPAKYVIRTLTGTIMYLYGNSPSYIRFSYCVFGRAECDFSLVYLFLGWTSYLVAALLNATRVPERLVPNTFDVFGHNHQWFHVVTTLGTVSLYWAIQQQLKDRWGLIPDMVEGITVWSSVGWVLLTMLVTSAIVVWFGRQLDSDGRLKNHAA